MPFGINDATGKVAKTMQEIAKMIKEVYRSKKT